MNVVAERVYRRGRKRVTLRIGRPEPDPKAPDRGGRCPVQIVGLGNDRIEYVYGVDEFQALVLTMVHSQTRVGKRAGELRYANEEKGDLGLPRIVYPHFLGPKMHETQEQALELIQIAWNLGFERGRKGHRRRR